MTDAIAKLERLRVDLPHIQIEKRPRQFAAEIIAMSTRDERRQALDLIPEEHRAVVRFYVATHFARRDRKPLPDLKP